MFPVLRLTSSCRWAGPFNNILGYYSTLCWVCAPSSCPCCSALRWSQAPPREDWDFRQQVRNRGTRPPEKQRILLLCIDSVTYSENVRKGESSDDVLALGISQGHWWLCDSFFRCINHWLNVCLPDCTTLDMPGDVPKEEVGKGERESCLQHGIVIYLLWTEQLIYLWGLLSHKFIQFTYLYCSLLIELLAGSLHSF